MLIGGAQLYSEALGRAAGFSLQEIATMLPPKEKPQIKREMLTAKADDGTVTLDSREGEGTTFTLRLPLEA